MQDKVNYSAVEALNVHKSVLSTQVRDEYEKRVKSDGDTEDNSQGFTVYQKLRLFRVLIDFSLTVKAATLIFISGRGSSISSANEGKSGFIHNLVKS